MSDSRKIGTFFLFLGIFFLLLGMLLLFDRKLLAMGNMCGFLTGRKCEKANPHYSRAPPHAAFFSPDSRL